MSSVYAKIESATYGTGGSSGGGGHGQSKATKPLFTLEDEINNDDVLLTWLRNARDNAVQFAEDRNRTIHENFALYGGEFHLNIEGRAGRSRSNGTPSATASSPNRPETAKIVINHLFDLTENKVSRFAKYKENIEVLPSNSDEVSDRMAAATVKELIDYLRYINDFVKLNRQASRMRLIAGEHYLFVEWDPDKGDALDDGSGESVPQGDIGMRIPHTRDIFLEPRADGLFEKCNYYFERELADAEELRHDYPELASQIKDLDLRSTGYSDFDQGLNDMEDDSGVVLEGKVLLWKFIHKGNKYLPEGRCAYFTDDVVLKNTPHPYKHKRFPFIRVCDLEIDGELYGRSNFQNVKQPANLLNNIYSMIYRSLALAGAGKWVYPRTARVNREELGNDITGLKYDGQIPPKFEQPNSVPTEFFAFSQDLKEVIQTFFGVFGVSRGEPPPGVRANVAMRYLEEQENERFNSDIEKHKTSLRQMWMLALEVVRQFYLPSDQRLVRILGKNKEYQIKNFNPAALNTPMDIRIQNSSNLPEGKASRTQTLLDIDERRPLPDDVFFDYLDLGIPEAYTNEVTQAKKAADIENDSFTQGKIVEEPAEWEEHLAHWQRHYLFIQGRGFKTLDPMKQQQALKHLMVHEMFLFDKAFMGGNITMPLNPALAQMLAQMPNFPAVYKPMMNSIPTAPPMPMGAPGMGGGPMSEGAMIPPGNPVGGPDMGMEAEPGLPPEAPPLG